MVVLVIHKNLHISEQPNNHGEGTPATKFQELSWFLGFGFVFS